MVSLIQDIPGSFSPLALVSFTARTADLVQWIAAAGIVVMGASVLLCLYRIVRGPTLADRATAIDVIGIQLIGIVILLTMLSGSLLFVDGMLVLALLSFAGTIAMAQFIARPYVLRYKAQSAPEEQEAHEATPPASSGQPGADSTTRHTVNDPGEGT